LQVVSIRQDPSVNCDDFEVMFGGDLHRGLDVIDYHQEHTVGTIERDTPFALTPARSEVNDLVSAETTQLIGGHVA
jgi:hypothetical protein